MAAAERWADDGISVNAVMPGNVGDTGLARNTDMEAVAGMIAAGELALPPGKTVQQGAATSVLMAASPAVVGVTGRYYEDRAEAKPVAERAGAVAGVAPYALDRDNAARLWAVSASLIQCDSRHEQGGAALRRVGTGAGARGPGRHPQQHHAEYLASDLAGGALR